MISTARVKKRLYLIVVRYFRMFANISLKRWKPRIIAVTGSVGKTTLLNLLEVQLGARAHYSHNANSSYGIAFDILGMDGVRGSKLRWFYLFVAAPVRSVWFRHNEEFFVVEIDGERPKETEFLASWLQPEVTLWVSVGRTHAVYFDGQVKAGLFDSVDEAIVHEFSYLPKYTSKLVAFNGESELIVRTMEAIEGAEKVGVTDALVTDYKVWPDKTKITVGDVTYVFNEPMPGEVYTQLALLAELAKYLGEPAVTDLTAYVQPPGRSNFFEGKNGVRLIDSTYNAHLISVQSIIDLYKDMQTEHKWIVIGDIVEQGEAEAEEHAKLGRLLREAEFERYVLVGRRTQKYTYPEMDADRTVTFLHPKDALNYLETELAGNETVLFKGSQYLEGVVEHLLADPHDIAKLPRQEPAAKKRRAKWGL
ncbi:MAG TPA: cyanophycin synthetase [Candidatus Saccharibacteria bacterium]|nr:cyanophycin synthetase [Candidatus Saccharibacteria bacterium]